MSDEPPAETPETASRTSLRGLLIAAIGAIVVWIIVAAVVRALA